MCNKHPSSENICIIFIITSYILRFPLCLFWAFSWLSNHFSSLSSYVRFSCDIMCLIGPCLTLFNFSASFSDWLASHNILKVNHTFSLWVEKNQCSKASTHFEIWLSLSDCFCHSFVILCKISDQKSGFPKATKLRMLLILGLLQLEILRWKPPAGIKNPSTDSLLVTWSCLCLTYMSFGERESTLV